MTVMPMMIRRFGPPAVPGIVRAATSLPPNGQRDQQGEHREPARDGPVGWL